MIYKIKNRYNTDIVFDLLEDEKTCLVSMVGVSYVSFSQNDKEEITMADPEGGPPIFLGADLLAIILSDKEFLKQDYKLVVNKIECNPGELKIIYSKQKIKSHPNHAKKNIIKEGTNTTEEDSSEETES